MCKKSESTLQMIRGYAALHAEGLGPKDIAAEFGVSDSTVYNYLDEIAEANGVARESLLIQPHSKHNYPELRQRPCNKTVVIDDVCKHIENVRRKIVDGRQQVRKNIREMTMYLEEV